MAAKNQELDRRITEAAAQEFSALGFEKASMRHIAARAGLTTGALYTRYPSKDVLFTSLIQDFPDEVPAAFAPISALYEEALAQKDPDKFLNAIRTEEHIYLDLMFRHYDACVLFFCRSDGSSAAAGLQEMMDAKARDTVAYFTSIAKQPIDLDGIAFIITEQFHDYRRILERGWDQEKALSCMKTVEAFLEAGWKELFRQIL